MGMKPRAPRRSGGFAAIHRRAIARKGPEQLEALLPRPSSARELRALRDDRVLSRMAQCIFSAGFVWKVVENKWPSFEEAFRRFDVGRTASLDEAALDELAQDRRVIRNRPKLAAVRDNARFIAEVAGEHGSFGAFVASWPDDDTVGLWREMSRRGNRLGGFTGPMTLRHIGKDTFMLSGDVVKALVAAGVVDKQPTSQRDLAAVQAAFNAWRAETGLPHCQLSRILACSVD